jgi:DNA-binding transcriptional LysR family regulator
MDIDLNLLRIFDTLMELRSATRAANRLGITQSAVSHALGRLRQALDDPLFTRSTQGLQPTVRALEMAAGVREGLIRLTQTLAPARDGQPPAQRRFTIAAGSYFCAVLIPELVRRARRDAPEMAFRVVPFGEHLAAALDRGMVDLAFGAFERTPGRFVVEPLYDDRLVWIAAADSETARLPFDAERIAAMPRVSIVARMPFDPQEAMSGDDLLVSSYVQATSLDEPMTVYDSLTAIAVVAMSEMVAMVPLRIAERAHHAVTVIGPGIDRRIGTSMLWHSRQRADEGLAQLRALARTLA